MPAKLTHQDFIRKAIATHGDLYSYEKAIFLGIGQDVKIKCNRCNTFFLQNARSHYSGRGCAKCNASGGGSVKLTTKAFITRAKTVHGNKYLYTNVDYKGAHHNVTIACRKHGEFRQSATSHLSGAGCPSCGKDLLKESGLKKRVPLSEWLRRFSNKHGTTYDYSNIKTVKNQYVKVPIRCQTHGVFEQAAVAHANGSGCPRCAFSLKYVDKANAWMRGYEPQAFEFIVKHKLAKRSEISVSVPKIVYEFAGNTLKYTPDFFIESQNRIVEVKSIGTLGLKGSMASPKRAGHKLLAKLKAKRRGCIKAGFKFSLLLMHDTKRLALPADWYTLSIKELRRLVNEQLHTRL